VEKKKLTTRLSIDAELYAALWTIAWEKGKSPGQILEEKLKQDPEIEKELEIIHEEPHGGVDIVNPAFLKRISREQEKRTE
jgi:hypothetical protein